MSYLVTCHGRLEQLNMGQYCQNFIDCGATMNILMSINENELKNVLGVKCLHDRRILNDALFILKQSKDKTVCGHVPEHTQMLNFLMNTRLLFSWILFVIQVTDTQPSPTRKSRSKFPQSQDLHQCNLLRRLRRLLLRYYFSLQSTIALNSRSVPSSSLG